MELSDWETLGINEEHHRLFVLLWRQLLDDLTPDTWQVRSTNVLTLLVELEAVAHIVLNEHAPSAAAFPDLVAEIGSSVRRDHVITSTCPWFASAVANLSQLVEQAGSDRAKVEAIARSARVLRERVARGYRKALESRLVERVAGDRRLKEELLDLTVSYATLLVLDGVSIRHLRAASEQCLENPALPFVERVTELIKLCSLAPIEHQVHFTVKEWEPSVVLRRRGCWVKPVEDARIGLPGARTEEFLRVTSHGDRVVCLPVEATDPFAARVAAEAQLARDFAAISISTHREPEAVGAALVVSEIGSMLVGPDGSRRNSVRRPRDWESRTQDLLSLGEILEDDDHRQLSAVLQYYRLAVTHPSDEVRLVNLWVATETLVSRLRGDSIIGRICENLPPLLAVRNVRKVAKHLARMLANSVQHRELRRIGVLGRGERIVEPAPMLDALLDDTRGRELLGLLEHDPLLKFRLFRFADKSLKSGASAADYIEQNRRNIEWQLGRISRARNAIVHRAESPENTRQLLQHLQSYVWVAVRQVSEELRLAEGRWSLNDVLEHYRTLYSHAMSVLRASEKPPLSALLDPSTFLNHRETPRS